MAREVTLNLDENSEHDQSLIDLNQDSISLHNYNDEGIKSIEAKTVGFFLMQARQNQGLGQAEVAEEVGISRSTLSMVENGQKGMVGFQTVLNLLELYEVNLEFKFAVKDNDLIFRVDDSNDQHLAYSDSDVEDFNLKNEQLNKKSKQLKP